MKYYIAHISETEETMAFLYKQNTFEAMNTGEPYKWLWPTFPEAMMEDPHYQFDEDDLKSVPSPVLANTITQSDGYDIFDENEFKDLAAIINENISPLLNLLRLQADQDEDKGEE